MDKVVYSLLFAVDCRGGAGAERAAVEPLPWYGVYLCRRLGSMQAIERTTLLFSRRGALIELLIEPLRLVVGSHALSFPSP